jgi:hypothetical protein
VEIVRSTFVLKYVETQFAFDLYPKDLKRRIQDERKKQWMKEQRQVSSQSLLVGYD